MPHKLLIAVTDASTALHAGVLGAEAIVLIALDGTFYIAMESPTSSRDGNTDCAERDSKNR